MYTSASTPCDLLNVTEGQETSKSNTSSPNLQKFHFETPSVLGFRKLPRFQKWQIHYDPKVTDLGLGVSDGARSQKCLTERDTRHLTWPKSLKRLFIDLKAELKGPKQGHWASRIQIQELNS